VLEPPTANCSEPPATSANRLPVPGAIRRPARRRQLRGLRQRLQRLEHQERPAAAIAHPVGTAVREPRRRLQSAVGDDILASLHGTDGESRTFQYVHAYGRKAARRFRWFMGERFDGFERAGPILRNVSPTYVLRYWRAK